MYTERVVRFFVRYMLDLAGVTGVRGVKSGTEFADELIAMGKETRRIHYGENSPCTGE
jgi:hypothetical protein